MLTRLFFLGALSLSACGAWVDPAEHDKSASVACETGSLDGGKLTHFVFAEVLRRHTKSAGSGYVVLDYPALLKDGESRGALTGYLQALGCGDPKALESKNERLAYWVNAYNGAVIKSALEGMSKLEAGKQESFSPITSGIFFDTPLPDLKGLTLNQIEHGVARGDFARPELQAKQAELKVWHDQIWAGKKVDPRLHAVFNCGALSCPNLKDKGPFVYQAQTLEQDLAAQTKAWLAEPKKGAGPEGISELFNWYKADFVASHGSVKGFIEAHRDGGVTGVKLDKFLTYDWRLNSPGNTP